MTLVHGPGVSKIERAMIRLALRDHHSNLDDAARALGISRKGLYLKRQRFGLQRPPLDDRTRKARR